MQKQTRTLMFSAGLVAALLGGTFGCAHGDKRDDAASGAPSTEDEKTLYALGRLLGENLAPLKLTAAETRWLTRGIQAEVAKEPAPFDVASYQEKQVADFARGRAEASAGASRA